MTCPGRGLVHNYRSTTVRRPRILSRVGRCAKHPQLPPTVHRNRRRGTVRSASRRHRTTSAAPSRSRRRTQRRSADDRLGPTAWNSVATSRFFGGGGGAGSGNRKTSAIKWSRFRAVRGVGTRRIDLRNVFACCPFADWNVSNHVRKVFGVFQVLLPDRIELLLHQAAT